MFTPPDSLAGCAAQCVMVRLGSHLPPVVTAEADLPRRLHLLEMHPIGGVLLFRAATPDVAHTLSELQGVVSIPLLVAADVERGIGQQVQGATLFPHARALAQTPDPVAAAAMVGDVTAREARTCGIHLALAPVADVNTYALNPIIGVRSFGTKPDIVSACVQAYINAAQDLGLATTAKHFPGHGRTVTDSHATLPTVDASDEEMQHVDLPPFQTAIDAGVEAMMTAHVAYPALGAEGPATASQTLLHDRLREAMGFSGLIVSDSLRMDAVQSPACSPSALVQAGVDLLLDPVDATTVVEELVAAVQDGRLAEERLREACNRVLALKRTMHERWGPKAFVPTDVNDEMGTASTCADADRLAWEALTLTRSKAIPWPLSRDAVSDGTDLMVVHLTQQATDKAMPLKEAFHEAYPSVVYRTWHPGTSSAEQEAIRTLGHDRPNLVVVCTTTPAAWHAFGLSREQRLLLHEWMAARPVVLGVLGSAEALPALPDATATICTYSDVPAAQRALVRALVQGTEH